MKAYKALKPDLTTEYGNFQFEIGKKYSVEEEIELCKNGFHACEKVEDVFKYYYWDARIFEVEIDGDIKHEEDKVVARHCTLLREITDEVKNTEGMVFEALKRNGLSIDYIENPTEEMMLVAVNQSGWAIMYIDRPSEAVEMAAVQQSGEAIQFISNPSEELQMAAVKMNAFAVRYIDNPTEAVQFAVINSCLYAYEYIKNPSETVTRMVNNRRRENLAKNSLTISQKSL
jgi:hypothetical protein